MATNAFTAPRRPVFDTPEEQARQRMSAGGKKGGSAAHAEQSGTVNPKKLYRPDRKPKTTG